MLPEMRSAKHETLSCNKTRCNKICCNSKFHASCAHYHSAEFCDDLKIKRFFQIAKANNVQCHCFCP